MSINEMGSLRVLEALEELLNKHSLRKYLPTGELWESDDDFYHKRTFKQL